MRARISQGQGQRQVAQMFLAERQGGEEEDTNNACGLLHVLFLCSRFSIIERRTLEMI
jgi:hypothetical protein